MKHNLVICTDKEMIKPIEQALIGSSRVEIETTLDTGIAKFRTNRYEHTFIETSLLKKHCELEDSTYEKAIASLKTSHPSMHIIVFSSSENLRETVNAVKAGASDYLISPIKPEEVTLITRQTVADDIIEAKLDYFKDKFWSHAAADIVVTKSRLMSDVYQKVKSVANTTSTVLLTGETGVGKTLVARLIHEHSARKKGPFVSVHCGAIPDGLVESELFGHEKGSFTGAIKRKLGRFEIANGGTIFLDEIGTLSQGTQVKLLQVLQESLFQRVGGESDIKVDVRIIAATNENLKELSDQKQFRNDLFYRLNVFPIEIPALRDRREDIPLLCEGILKKLNRSHSKDITGISATSLEALQTYNWPGNIRELENVLERAYIIETTQNLSIESLPLEMATNAGNNAIVPLNMMKTLAEVRSKAIEDIERQYLKELLSDNRGKINETAQMAGVGVRQLHKLMTKYDLSKEDFKSHQLAKS